MKIAATYMNAVEDAAHSAAARAYFAKFIALNNVDKKVIL